MTRRNGQRILAILLLLSIVGTDVRVASATEFTENVEDQTEKEEEVKKMAAENGGQQVEDSQREALSDLDISNGNKEENGVLENDPEKGDKANSWRYKDGEQISSKERYSQYTTWPTDVPGAVGYGIDVSEHQGVINWSKVQAAGVEYAIIRCGYGQDQEEQDDDYWYVNANACKQYGIPFSTYLYSYADTVAKAQSEAKHVLRLVSGYDLSYPIYYDLEESSIRSKLSTTQIADVAEAFCDIIESAGYEVAVYANTDWFTNYLTDSRFAQWDKWVAQYNTSCTYAGEYNMWQCSSQGIVNGISGNVDLNIDLGASITAQRNIVVIDGKIYGYEGKNQLFGAQKIGDSWYYFDSGQDGAAFIGWRKDEDKIYYYDEEGHLAQGAKKIGSYWYYFSGNGNMYTGWRKDGEKTYYYDAEGHLAQGAQKIGSHWYFFSGNGNMYTGWRKDGEKIYYYDAEGHLAQGAQKIGSYWYYFSGNGNMYTGWRKDGEKTYYYDEEGHLVQGAKKIGSYWYYFSGNGNMYTGWRKDGEKTYYYDEEGHLAQGAQKIGPYWYYFSGNGNMYIGWRKDGSKTYYYDEEGHLAQKATKIDGKWYYFSSNGELQ